MKTNSLTYSVTKLGVNYHGEKADIIVGFLAVLELVKQGALLVRQDERFGNIEIKKQQEI